MADSKRFGGVNVVLTTPLDADERIDESALRKQLRRVLTGGVHGVVVLGSAGEFAALRDEEKRRAISITVDEVEQACRRVLADHVAETLRSRAGR